MERIMKAKEILSFALMGFLLGLLIIFLNDHFWDMVVAFQHLMKSLP